MNCFIKLFLTLFVCATTSGCLKTGGRCEEAINTSSSGISISFKDTSGVYIYREINPPLSLDSLRIFDSQGQELAHFKGRNQIPNSIQAYTVVSFGSLFNEQLDQSSYQSELCKKYFILYNSIESDTLQVCFKSKPGKCGSIFESLKIVRDGQMIYSATGVVSANIVLTKS